MQVILNAGQIDELINKLAREVAADVPEGVPVALVGIRSRGEILAQRLQPRLQACVGSSVEVGVLDITLYRDDLNEMRTKQPTVRSTEIDFSIDDRLIVLVDDVLHTGRSTRAALDALMDLGRPRAIRLAVLVDRGHREMPIGADYVGRSVEAGESERVSVYFQDGDGREEVVIE